MEERKPSQLLGKSLALYNEARLYHTMEMTVSPFKLLCMVKQLKAVTNVLTGEGQQSLHKIEN